MVIFEKLFKKKTSIDIENLDVGEYFYLMSYNEHYTEFLSGIENKNKIIAELFVFRAWTTQFGFRIFSSQPDVSEEIIGKVFNQSKLGKGMLRLLEHVDIEIETNLEFIELMNNRWKEYDSIFNKYKNSEISVPTRQICSRFLELCDVNSPVKFIWICTDFTKQLEIIKHKALKIGLLN